jgi:hypothetical protein
MLVGLVTSNTQVGRIETTLVLPSPPMTGATTVMPFWPLRTTRPVFSQAGKSRVFETCGSEVRVI